MTDYTELKRLAEAFPEYEWDSNTEPFFNGPSGESLGGGSTGFYCVYGPEFEIDGDSYDGVTLVESCPVDQAKFICEAKAGILALIAENERLEMSVNRSLNLDFERRQEIDQLKAENAGFKTGYQAYEAQNAALRGEVEVLRGIAETSQKGAELLSMDAERYRWIKERRNDFDLMGLHSYYTTKLWNKLGEQSDWDAAIDAAMGKGEQS